MRNDRVRAIGPALLPGRNASRRYAGNFSRRSTVSLLQRSDAALSMITRLSRTLALALLCVGLLVAGAPAVACCAAGTPAHDCCPNRSHPVGPLSYERGPQSDVRSCCAAGAQTAAVSASDVTPGKTDIQPTRADPPLSIDFAALGAIYSSTLSSAASAVPSFFPALSPLYLRTRRLRL